MPMQRSAGRDTTLYDLLEVSPDASQAQIAKVRIEDFSLFSINQ